MTDSAGIASPGTAAPGMPAAVAASATGLTRTEADIRASVRAVVLELAPQRVEGAADDAQLIDDLGYHSLPLLELAFTLEDEFDLDPIEEATARRLSTVGAIIDHVLGQLAARGAVHGAVRGAVRGGQPGDAAGNS